MALLEVQDLRIGFPGGSRMVEVVRGVSFTVNAGEAVGLVGESGSGKSQTALAILRLLRSPGQILGGSVRLDGQELTQADEATMRKLRGGTISIVFQDAMSGLNPVFPIGVQLCDVIRAHRRVSVQAARDIAVETLELVGIRNAADRLGQFPHQFSGGMRQRVLIAMAVACRPRLLIADEPTTALDVTVQKQIVTLLHDLRQRLGLALLFITHNLDLMAEICDRAVVLYGGMVMEDGCVGPLFAAPKQPYTRALIDCVPRLSDRAGDLRPIQGASPVPGKLGDGCPFAPRCASCVAACTVQRPPVVQQGQHRVACWNPVA
jgi:peptide/nickel transport system ATP-binding protein/oligopeptide transport system ATP-binding protein